MSKFSFTIIVRRNVDMGCVQVLDFDVGWIAGANVTLCERLHFWKMSVRVFNLSFDVLFWLKVLWIVPPLLGNIMRSYCKKQTIKHQVESFWVDTFDLIWNIWI